MRALAAKLNTPTAQRYMLMTLSLVLGILACNMIV